jgi:hypothetical protein
MSIRISKETAPATPPSDKAYLYLDTSDNIFKVKVDSGTIYSLNSSVISGTPANNQVMTAVSSTAIQGESNLTFDGTTLALTGYQTVSNGLDVSGGFLSIGSNLPTLTIASGVITATDSYHRIDTEGGAATDDLDTINGFSVGKLLVLCAADNTHDVVLKDGTGNLALAGDFTMDSTNDRIVLIGTGSTWIELCRSNN